MKGLDSEELNEIISVICRDSYLHAYGSDGFIDKTIRAVACHGWAVMKDVFPNALFLACVRSPVEVYESADQKSSASKVDAGRIDPIELAEGWVGAMKGIEGLANNPFAGDLLVGLQLELLVEPEMMMERLPIFLEAPDPAIADEVSRCKLSRDDVLIESIEKTAYKLLDEPYITSSSAHRLQRTCEPTCSSWGIGL